MTKIVILQQGGSAGPSLCVVGPNGSVGRRRINQRNPRTLEQETHRNILSGVSSEWRFLTDEQRTAWHAFGRQLPGRLTGSQVFTKINVRLIKCGLPRVIEPPGMPVFGILKCAGLATDDTPTVKLLQVSSTLPADRLVIAATPPLRPSLQNVKNRFRELISVPGPTAVPIDVDLTAAYLGRFLDPQAGRRIFVRLSLMSNGFRTPPQTFNAVVAKRGG